MLLYAVAVLSMYLAVASSRETLRPMPTITSSLVNLGKMEISFYFNGNGRDTPAHPTLNSARSNAPFFPQKPELIVEESCPCSSLRNMKDSFLSNPSGILNKLLMTNDLFSFNKDPISSTFCCDSHEQHTQEGTVVFEFAANPKNSPFVSRSNPLPIQNNVQSSSNFNKPMSLPVMPFFLDNLISTKSVIPNVKSKAIEILLFPNKKANGNFEISRIPQKKKDLISKDNIQIVGDKELKNNIHLFKPVYPVVKKDLNLQEKNEKQKKAAEKEQKSEKEERETEKKEKEEKTIEEEDKKGDNKDEGDQILIEPANKPNVV